MKDNAFTTDVPAVDSHLSGCIRLTGRVLASARHPPRVLVVEDEPATRDAIVALLAVEGFDVSAARSGFEAVDMIRTWIPDIAVLDIRLPEYDGFAVASVLRGIAATAQIALVAATAYDPAEFARYGDSGHFDALFCKGEDGGELTALLRSFLPAKG